MPFGCPGGDGQTQAMLQVFLNVAEFGMNPQQRDRAAAHHQRVSFPNSFWPHGYHPGLLERRGPHPRDVRADSPGAATHQRLGRLERRRRAASARSSSIPRPVPASAAPTRAASPTRSATSPSAGKRSQNAPPCQIEQGGAFLYQSPNHGRSPRRASYFPLTSSGPRRGRPKRIGHTFAGFKVSGTRLDNPKPSNFRTLNLELHSEISPCTTWQKFT